MQLSPIGEKLIKLSEALVLKVYPDIHGVLTAGWGHTGWYAPGVPLALNQVVTEELAEQWFFQDTADAVQAVNKHVTVPITQNQFDALADFTFNLGAAALAHSTLLKFLNAGHPDDAANELLRWDYAGGHQVAGLEDRRRLERELFLTAPGARPPVELL
ncbi:MAG: lysozyme [Patescibacteria group bacterium]|nr:lysozyme [Patescibacteria group bacterium]